MKRFKNSNPTILKRYKNHPKKERERKKKRRGKEPATATPNLFLNPTISPTPTQPTHSPQTYPHTNSPTHSPTLLYVRPFHYHPSIRPAVHSIPSPISRSYLSAHPRFPYCFPHCSPLSLTLSLLSSNADFPIAILFRTLPVSPYPYLSLPAYPRTLPSLPFAHHLYPILPYSFARLPAPIVPSCSTLLSSSHCCPHTYYPYLSLTLFPLLSHSCFTR